MLRNLNLGQKLTLFLVAILISAFLIGALVLTKVSGRIVQDTAAVSAETINKSVVNMVDVFAGQVERGADRLMSALQMGIHESFRLDKTNSVRIGERATPVLSLGGKTVNLDFSLVDHFTKETGGVATIFVRDGDNFVRISTSLKKEDGSRAIGTTLDTAHPAYQKLLNGESYRGAAQLFGRDYYTKYVPIRENNTTIGILFVGVDYTDEIKSLRDRIKATKVGESGYVYVLNTKEGKTKGHLVVHPEMEGQSLLEATDADGKFFVKEMLEKKQGVVAYPWKAAGEISARDKIVAYGSSDKFGWMIASGAYVDDLGRSILAVESVVGIIAVILAIGLPILIAIAIRKMVTGPLGELQRFCQKVQSTHDFTLTAPHSGNDEVGQTCQAVADLMATLRQTFGTLLNGVLKIDEAAHQLTESSQKTSRHSEMASESASSMAAAVEEMTVGINHISDNANVATQLAHSAGERSRDGCQTITRATDEMAKIASEVGEASAVIVKLGEETGRISSIVSVIREVADQTNLLALNAAIEAARAGESGRGFAVVADEVRKLAERTTASSGQIADMISAIQTLSAQATRIMEQTAGQAQEGAVLANQAGSAINDIQESAEKVLHIIQEISMALGEQSSASQQIAIQTEQVARVAEENSQVAADSTRAAEHLENLGEDMRAQVQRFKFN